MEGTILRYNRSRGFGFIEPHEGDTDLFFHISALPEADRCLKNIEGRAVSFEVGDYNGRPQAMQVRFLPSGNPEISGVCQ